MNEISKWEREMDKPSVKETRAQPQSAEVQSQQWATYRDELSTWDSHSDNAKLKWNASNAEHNKFLGWCQAKLNDVSDKKIFKKKVFPQAESAIKSHIINSGLDKLISSDKLSAKLADTTRALTTKEMQSQLRDDWNPGITGSNDGKITRIDINQVAKQAKETTIHEYYHQLSANDVKTPSGSIEKRRGISVDGRDDGMNEALTQKYTLDTMKESDPDYRSKCPYNNATEYIDKLYPLEGNGDMFDVAYFQNKPSLLEYHFNHYCGKGFYQELSLHFDAVVHGDPWLSNQSSGRIGEMIKKYIQARSNSSIEGVNT